MVHLLTYQFQVLVNLVKGKEGLKITLISTNKSILPKGAKNTTQAIVCAPHTDILTSV